MDQFLRFLIYLALGAGLLFGNALYIRSIISAFRSDETVIVPVVVVGQEDKDGKLGIALARMLAFRLTKLQSEIASSQQWMAKDVQVFHPAAIRSKALPLEPLKIDAKVAGVDVGTVLPWVQNALSRPRSIAFTLDFLDKDKVLITGDLKAVSGSGRGVVSFQSSSAHDKIVDDMAHAVLQARLESSMHDGFDTIEVAEFEQVVKSLDQVAAVNQAIAQGDAATTEDLNAIVRGLSPVAIKLSSWWELSYVTALAAQRAADPDTAITFYEAVKTRASMPNPPIELISLVKTGEIDQAIVSLRKAPEDRGAFEEDRSNEARLARPKIEADMAYATGLYEKAFSLQRPPLELKIIKEQNNAFYAKNAYYAPAAVQYLPDVTYHEVSHAFIENLGKMGYDGQSGAIVESYADICASWVSQRKSGQSADSANWLIGVGGIAVFLGDGDPQHNRAALRSLKAPGTASKYDTSVSQYTKIPKQGGDIVHVAMGVPNKAFYETAIRIGTDKAITIWIAAIPALKPNVTIPELAVATISVARSTLGEGFAAKVNEAWGTVGLGEKEARAASRGSGQQ